MPRLSFSCSTGFRNHTSKFFVYLNLYLTNLCHIFSRGGICKSRASCLKVNNNPSAFSAIHNKECYCILSTRFCRNISVAIKIVQSFYVYENKYSVEGTLCHLYPKLKKVVILKHIRKLYFLVSRDNIYRSKYWSKETQSEWWTFLLNMIVTIVQSCIYIKHEVCRTVRPEIGSRYLISVFHSNLYNICGGLGKT